MIPLPSLRVLLGTLLLLPLCMVRGIQPPAQPPLENFDIRTAAPAPPSPPDPALEAAASALQSAVPGARVDRPAHGFGPKFVGSTRGFLTPREAAPPPAAGGKADDHRGLKTFLGTHRGFFGHGPEALGSAPTTRDSTHGRLRTTVWQQQLDGIRIHGATLQANATIDGELVNVASSFVPDPALAAPGREPLLAAPPIDSRRAVALAATNAGDAIDVANVVVVEGPAGTPRRQKLRAPRLLDISGELVWFPLDEKKLRLAWQVVFVSKARGNMFQMLVDAENGTVLLRQNLTNYISNASYRVYTSDSPSPLSPGHPTPLTAQPSTVARSLVVTPALDTTASPNGWINDGVNETRGNNVDAHLDLNADDIADTPRPQGAAGRVFDFPLNLSQAPSTYRDASVTQLFYLCNWIHDRLYAFGFTEAAGNFQNDNFGRGGFGNDAVQADAQDGEGTDNANFSTPGDGSAPRMQMFVFTGPTPDRDGSFDAEIVVHEYVHGLSNRLVGGGVGISQLQPAGMGEGWSDFYALALLSEPADDPNATYAAGGYATYQLGGMTTNYYYGIRRYPYTTDLNKNPLTFRDLDPAQASAHTGIPRSPVIGNTANEVHNMGELWCVTLWDARANLIAKHGAVSGNQLILQLVTDGMKLSPPNPTFLQARDAILQADLVASGGSNRLELWTAFARRGMGANATSPASSTTTGVVEDFSLPDDLQVTPLGTFTARGPLSGPFAPSSRTYTLTNTQNANVLPWTASADVPWVTLSATSGTLSFSETTTVTASINASAASLPAGTHVATVTFSNQNTGVSQVRTIRILVALPDYFTELFTTHPNDTAFQSWTFTPDGSSSFYRVLRTAGVTAFPTNPAGGTTVSLTDDSAATVNLPPGTEVSLYGSAYSTFFIGSNGYVTFDSADTGYDESLSLHFSLPRIAALIDDLNPSSTGTISWKQLADRVAVTWQNVPEYGTTNSNSFQIEMFFDGQIRITCLGIAAGDGLIGLSAGTGVPTDFDESDFSSYSTLALAVTLPTSALETAGTVSGTITASTAPASDLTITLTSSDTAEATVPATVTLLAGQTSVSFSLSVQDDALLDGSRPVTVSASAAGYASFPATILVHDNETATITLTAPATAVEGGATLTGTVTLSAPAGKDIAVPLTSSDPLALAVPATVTIPVGLTSASFSLEPVDDLYINGTRVVNLTAAMQNWTTGTASVSVQDNETSEFFLTLPAEVFENGTGTGTVSVSGIVITPTVVTLTSSAPGRLSVPATVTVPAGLDVATFTLTAPNNSLTEGSQSVQISASRSGFTGASDTVLVRDDDVHSFAIAPIASPQVRGVPFPVTITARDLGGATIPVYAGTPALAISGGGTVTPATASGFSGGVWTGNVTANQFGTGLVLAVSDGAGHSGTSNAFDVGVGALSSFSWAPITGPFSVGASVPVTVTAKDAGGNTIPTYTGTASLSGFIGTPDPSTIVISEVNPATPDEIEFTNVSSGAVNIGGWTVHIYDSDTWPAPRTFTIPTGTTCAAGAVFRLQEFGTAPGTFPQFFFGSNINWTSDSASPIAVLLRNASGTIVDFFCAAAGTPASITSPSTIPAAQWSGATTTATGSDSLDYSRTGSADTNVATDWASATPSLGTANTGLVVPFPGNTSPVTISPTTSGSFVSGIWTGFVVPQQEATQMRLRADAGSGRRGDSNAFNVVGSANLTVTPASGLSSSGPFGGPFTPASQVFTLTNSGTAALTWTAVKSGAWFTLSATSGSLAPGASTTVTASIPTALHEPGTYTDTLTFANATNGAGNTTRPIALSIALTAPTMLPEPIATGGLTNTVAWNTVNGALRYEVQRATLADFSDAQSSGPLTATTHLFGSLTDGTLYRYRARSRRPELGAQASWNQTTQADFSAGTSAGVNLTPTGEVVLATNAAALIPGRVQNPSFEGASLTNWVVQTSGTGMNAQASTATAFPPMPTAGTSYAGMNSAHNTARTAGDFVRISQTVDFTSATALKFDALLTTPAGSTWSGSVQAQARIDGVVVWSSSTAGAQLDRTIDVSTLTGSHTLEFRAEVITSGTFNAQWVFVDNVRLFGVGYVASGSLTSPTVAPADLVRWETLTFSRNVSTAGTALTVDVLDSTGALLAANVANGTDLGMVPAIAASPSLRLRANLSTTNGLASPALNDWTLQYRLAGATDVVSAWSAAVSSRQDATPPTVTIANVTALPNTVRGQTTDASSIGSVTVNGAAATTSDSFASWSATTPLALGWNVVNYSAADTAQPPNVATGTTNVFFASMSADADLDGLPDGWEAANGLNLFDATGANGPLGDFDHDGASNLLEYAFGTGQGTADAAGQPLITRAINPSDLLPYLEIRYRHLLMPGPLTYRLELSSDLQSWQPAAAGDFELLGAPTPNPDGITETIALRLKPALSTPGYQTRHFRIQVQLPAP